MTAHQLDAQAGVSVVLTPAQAKVIARTIRAELAVRCKRALSAPLVDREDMARLRHTIELGAERLAMLDWGTPGADIEVVCPSSLLETVAQDLRDVGEKRVRDNDLAVCAVVEHLLEPVR